MSNPVIYASPRQYVGFGVEAIAGTAAVPAVTVPVNNFDPFDQPTFLPDNALRGSMTGPFNIVEGVEHTEFSMGGPAYFDTLGYLLSNIFGDVTYSATYTGSGTTTLSAAAEAGDITIDVAVTIAADTLIQIDTGVNAEINTVDSADGTTLTLTTALLKPHAADVAVKPVTTPNMQAFNVLNSGNGQPSTLTITDFQGPAGTSGMRAYPGCCLSELNLSGTMDSTTIMYDCKGQGWPSATAATFTSAPSTVKPQAAWETQVGLGGTVSGSPILTLNAWTLSFARVLQMYYTAANTQHPYSIFRGVLTATGTANLVVANETYLSYMMDNTQPQLQMIISNGLTGSDLLSMQIDAQECAFQTSKISRGNPAVEANIEFTLVANTTNTGFSGGFGPATVSMQNAVDANTY